MRPLDANRLHERGDVICEQIQSNNSLPVYPSRQRRVDRNEGEALGIVRDLEGATSPSNRKRFFRQINADHVFGIRRGTLAL